MNTLRYVILIGCLGYLAFLAVERALANARRRKLRHVVYVNGTRGKSSVTRLIDAGLRAGQYKVFSKTTGTLPMVIDVSGEERLIHRRGAASIGEQLRVLKWAADAGAEVLVCECMAITPELMRLSQHEMMRADIGVITNVRMDHMDVMGDTEDAICKSLMNTVPKNGKLFTADETFYPMMQEFSARIGTDAILAVSDGRGATLDFPENIALALEVCKCLGVSADTALEGFRRVKRDPYASESWTVSGCRFVDALSCNDPQSTLRVYQRAQDEAGNLPAVVLLNNRADRPLRSRQMAELCAAIEPSQVLLMGSQTWYIQKFLKNKCPTLPVTRLKRAEEFLPETYAGKLVFAAGNIKDEGIRLIARIRQLAGEKSDV